MHTRLLRFYMTEGLRHRHRPAYEWLLEAARESGIGGGTAIRAIAGFGRHGRLHDDHFFELAGELPVEVSFVLNEQQASTLLALVNDEGLSLFYTITAVDSGLTNSPLQR